MLIYWEQNVGGIQVENFNIEEENEDYEIQKPYMQSMKDEKQMEDLAINIILIFYRHMTNKSMSNNCRSEGFGMQIFEDDMSRIST